MSARDQVLESHQPTLESELDQRALAPEVARRPRQRGVQLMFAPRRVNIERVGHRQRRNAGPPKILCGTDHRFLWSVMLERFQIRRVVRFNAPRSLLGMRRPARDRKKPSGGPHGYPK